MAVPCETQFHKAVPCETHNKVKKYDFKYFKNFLNTWFEPSCKCKQTQNSNTSMKSGIIGVCDNL